MRAQIAFYFVHWLTDLAGADPTPLRGAEKFVVKFPRAVLGTLIESMPIVQRLVDRTPTALCEEYLHFAWARSAELGAPPSPPPSSAGGSAGGGDGCGDSSSGGGEAIALMRLLVQCQDPAKQQLLRAAFERMPEHVRAPLSTELALSGVAGERYAAAPGCVGGPAMLVYYMPAYLRHTCALAHAHERPEEADAALAVLGELLRAARVLWPLETTDAACGTSVTLMIDELKACSAQQVMEEHARGRCWVLQRSNPLHASVRRKPLNELPALLSSGNCELLQLWGDEGGVLLGTSRL